MLKLLQKLTILFFLFTICNNSFATHNRAGEITYRQTGPLTIEATITTYTKASSDADRDTLDICWGDGVCSKIPRINGPIVNGNHKGENIGGNIKMNKYVTSHTYPAVGHFTISMNDPNRNQGICNVNAPVSDNVPFHIETTVTLLNESLIGPNNSPILLQPPIDIGCVGEVFVHNPNAYDIAFELISPLQDVGSAAVNYQFPFEINPGQNNSHYLDPSTGIFTWTTPQEPCEYNIAFYIISYRNGIAIDTMIRDMQILILECDNEPPVIETIDEICVIAGEVLEFDVVTTAPIAESQQQVTISALGSPFEVTNSPATFNDATSFQQQPLTRTFRWETKCEHIADQYYQVVFRATDNKPLIIDVDTSYLSTTGSCRTWAGRGDLGKSLRL